MSETEAQWAHLLDDAGSADYYDTEAEAREMLAVCGGGLLRVETTIVVPFTPDPVPPVAEGKA
jgi:hypothetical protein